MDAVEHTDTRVLTGSSEGVSSGVTGAVVHLQNPDRPYANRYKRVKKELLFHAGRGGGVNQRSRLTAATTFPVFYPP